MNKYEVLSALVEAAVINSDRALQTQQVRTQPALPVDKHDFPKLLCLDLNKWVDLACAHYGRRGGESYADALEAIKTAVNKGSLVVAVASANIEEAAEPRDVARRERLSRFMVSLSRNHSLTNGIEVLQEELRVAVARHARGVELPPIRPSLLHRGMHAAVMGATVPKLAADAELVELANEVMLDDELAAFLLVHFTGQELVSEMRQVAVDTTSKLEQVRAIDAHLSIDERRQLELGNFLKDGPVADMLNSALRDAQLSASNFRDWLSTPANLLAFARDVPSVNVTSTLMLLRDVNKGHRCHVNDGKDFQFLQLAVPYANVVVAEKSWTHFLRNSQLDRHYETRVLTDVAELPGVLGELGC